VQFTQGCNGPGIVVKGFRKQQLKTRVIAVCWCDANPKSLVFQVLTLRDAEEETQDDRQGKMLLHTEYSLLSLLHNQDGVIHHHGFFKVNCLAQYNIVSCA
jgi:serine/threonine-protein kinase 40